jgi:peptide/nickel transport system ATP-binding protein
LTSPLLKVKDLSLGVKTSNHLLQLTDRVSFDIGEGEMVALVGESGCGKSITAMAIAGLLPDPNGVKIEGEVVFEGKDLWKGNPKDWQNLRASRLSMIFQEPSSALNPLMPVSSQMAEIFTLKGRPVDMQHLRRSLDEVGIPDPDRVLKSYPHELSGGMLQRVMIAMALLLSPKLIIADEPTTALDVTVQAQVMEILTKLQKDIGTAILLITHNLGLVAQYANALNVMYAGRIVERANTRDFLAKPLHPYSHGLLKALPRLDGTPLEAIPGSVPSPDKFSDGCRFAERCTHRKEACSQPPPWKVRSGNEDGGYACILEGER